MPTLMTERRGWNSIGVWIAAATTPAVADRKYDAVKALAGARIFQPDAYHNAIELRFTGDTNNHTLVFDLLASRGRDYFTRIATITCTVGQSQKGSASVLFVDTIVLSNVMWPTSMIEAISGADDYCARVWLDTLGYTDFALVATTVNGITRAEYSGV